MNEIKGSPVIRLKAIAKEFNFSKLTADQDNKLANSGETMFLDFQRMNFIINGKKIDKNLIIAFQEGAQHRKSELSNYDIYSDKLKRGIREIDTDNGKALIKDVTDFIELVFEDHISNKLDELWKNHCENPEIADHQKIGSYRKEFEKFYNAGRKCAHRLPAERDENKDYRSFAKEVFKEMFNYAGAEVPSDAILEELVTNCNQAGYEAALFIETQRALEQSFIVENPKKVINIDCTNQNNVRIRSDMRLPLFIRNQVMHGDKVCNLHSSLEFTIESHNGEDFVTYRDGKLLLIVPKELKNYKVGDKNLFDIIKGHFQKFCEKLRFKFKTKVQIEHDFGTKLDGTIFTEGSDANKEFINLLSKNLRLSKKNIRDSLVDSGVAKKKEDVDEEDVNVFIEHRISDVMGLLSSCAKLKNSKENRELLINEVADNLGISKGESTLRSLPSLMNGSFDHSQVQDITNIFTSLILKGKPGIYTQEGAINVIDAIHEKIGEAIVEQEKEATSEQQDITEHKWTDKIREQELSMKSHGR